MSVLNGSLNLPLLRKVAHVAEPPTPQNPATAAPSGARRAGRSAAPAQRSSAARQSAEVQGVGRSHRERSKFAAFVALTKPRIIELLLVETVPVMIVAARGWPGTALVVVTVLGGTLSAGAANAVNMVIDRDIDSVMERTRHRPLVTGEVTPRAALVFAIALEVISFVLLALVVNLLSAVLSFAAFAFYVGVYTMWLKRRYTSNIVIGGAAGAVPALIGWTAVTGTLAWPPVLLFLLIYLWTPPHFWALAVRYKDDYSSVSVPMLPSVAAAHTVGRKIVAYSLAMVLASLVFAPVADLGWLYCGTALMSGALFLGLAFVVARRVDPAPAMRLFHYSITYLTLLFAAMAADAWIGVSALGLW